MTAYSKSVLSYVDIHQVFEAAGKHGSVRLDFATPAQAVTWNGRANAYRVLLRQQNKDAGKDFTCQFDHLMVRRKPKQNFVIVEPRGFGFVATLPDGTPLDLSKQTLEAPVLTPHEVASREADLDSFLAEFEEKNKE
jgi:hypothetical protein